MYQARHVLSVVQYITGLSLRAGGVDFPACKESRVR